MPLRLIFMGTPDFAVPTLLELAAAGHEIVAVYTRAAKPAGRAGIDRSHLMSGCCELEQRRHREIGRAHEDQAKGHA